MGDNLPDVYLRFEGIKGDCNDENHPGKFKQGERPNGRKEGWMAISGFSFGFGWGSADTGDKKDKDKDDKDKDKKKKNKIKKRTSGTLKPKEFSFSKAPNVTSKTLLDKCHDGEVIPLAEVEVCRAGGESGDEKIPFLRIIFEAVTLKKCSLSISNDPVPSESVEFKFKKVTMETIWTDNTTGQRILSEPRRVMWDFAGNSGKTSWDTQ